MNPFLYPTVARPLQEAERVWNADEVVSEAGAADTSEANQSSGADAAVRKSGRIVHSRGSGRRSKRLQNRRRNVRYQSFCKGLAFAVGAIAPSLAFCVNVNVATVEQLQAVRGIGPKTAQIIVDERLRAGPYVSFDDLSERVKGIGPKKAAAMKSAGLEVELVPAANSKANTAAKPRK